MKYAIVFLLVALAVAQTYGQSNNIEWGKLGANDRQLYREIVVKSSQWLQIVTKDIAYQGGTRITHIKCTDQYTNGNGGTATLYAGGVGYNDVTVHLKSQRGHGFNFIIEVYGNDN